MKFGQILVCCETNIYKMFLAKCCDPCDPSLGSLEVIFPAQIYRADLTSVVFFLLSFVVIYSLNITYILYLSHFRSYSIQSFFSCVLLSLSSTFYLFPLSFFAYPLLSLPVFLVCLLLSFLLPSIFLL